MKLPLYFDRTEVFFIVIDLFGGHITVAHEHKKSKHADQKSDKLGEPLAEELANWTEWFIQVVTHH